nr:hypothetical protein Itr_chr03CG10320 [Ipomoea trifida]
MTRTDMEETNKVIWRRPTPLHVELNHCLPQQKATNQEGDPETTTPRRRPGDDHRVVTFSNQEGDPKTMTGLPNATLVSSPITATLVSSPITNDRNFVT